LSARSVLPPVSIDAERVILGALLIEGAAGYRRLSALSRPEQFFIEANREIFAAIKRLDAHGDAIDLLTVTEDLRRTGRLEAAGGPANLALLVEQASILVNLPSYEKIVTEEATKRAYLALGERLRHGATNGTGADELAAMAEAVLTEHRRSHVQRPDSAPTELSALLAHRFPPRADVVGRGILQRQTLVMGGGYSKVGKSILFDNLCLQRARGKPWLGFPTDPGVTLICSSEVPPEGVQSRFSTILQHDPDGQPPEGSIHIKTNRGLALVSSAFDTTAEAIRRLAVGGETPRSSAMAPTSAL
jgi:replicative DNA helicase